MYFLIIGIFILFCPKLTIAIQQSDCSVVKVEQLSTVYQHISLLQDIEDKGSSMFISESQIKVLRPQFPSQLKTLNFPKANNIYFLNKKNQIQISVFNASKFVPNYHICMLFTGLMLI